MKELVAAFKAGKIVEYYDVVKISRQ